MPIPEGQGCFSCTFWDPGGEVPAPGVMGKCRAFAPGYRAPAWLNTLYEDWCGVHPESPSAPLFGGARASVGRLWVPDGGPYPLAYLYADYRDLTVWPEAEVPGVFGYSAGVLTALTGMTVIFGLGLTLAEAGSQTVRTRIMAGSVDFPALEASGQTETYTGISGSAVLVPGDDLKVQVLDPAGGPSTAVVESSFFSICALV